MRPQQPVEGALVAGLCGRDELTIVWCWGDGAERTVEVDAGPGAIVDAVARTASVLGLGQPVTVNSPSAPR